MFTINSKGLSEKLIRLLLFLILISCISYSLDNSVVLAQGSKSSGNEVMKSVEAGKDYKGMTKEEVVAEIGEPWSKDSTPVKARYDEKWIYSCEAKDGLTYDCVYLYFMGGRVINVEVL